MATSVPSNRSRPTPTVLKWLAEKRARTAHDLTAINKVREELTSQAEKLEADLDALDRAMQIYDPRVKPKDIAPVNGWKGNYGQRGALKSYILEVIKAASPNWVATDFIRAKVMVHFAIVFVTRSQDMVWRRGSFRGAIKKLCSDGLIDREHDPDVKDGMAGRWRWSGAADPPTLSSLER